jgi:mannosyltransferase
VILTAVGGAIRFTTLGRQSFWFDELVTVSVLRRSFSHMLSAVPRSEATPYAYYVVAWAWSRVFGLGEAGLRSLSALAGTAEIPVVYAAGATLVSRRAGMIAAALVAFSPFLVWYSQEARAYALFTFFAACTLLFFARVLHRKPQALLWWSLSAALALATHYFAIFLVVPEALWLALRTPQPRRVVLASFLPAAVVGAELPLLFAQRGNGGAVSQASLASRTAGVPKDLAVGYSFPLELAGSIVAAVLVLVALALLVMRVPSRLRRPAVLAGALAGLSAIVPLVLAATGEDFLTSRNVIAAVLPGAICVAGGFAVGRAGAAFAAALGALLLAITLSASIDLRYGRTDWRGALRQLGPHSVTRAVVVTPPIPGVLLRPYVRGLRLPSRAHARLREIDVLGLATEGGFSTGRVRPPAPKLRAPPPGFRLVQIERHPTFTLLRYRAPHPERVDVFLLGRLGLSRRVPAGVLLEGTGS